MPRKKKGEEKKKAVEEEKQETFDRDEMEEALFLQLVLGLQSSAWMHMGKVPNPMTGEAEKNLMLAKNEIDLLMMLKNKTQGNLTENERVTINSSIQQLHINFINELEREMKAREDAKSAKGKGKKK